MLPNDQQWNAFYASMLSRTGIDFHLYKPQQLQRRILAMCSQQKCGSLTEFFQWLSKSPDNMVWFLDKMAINVSELFRNPEKWLDIEKKVLPELLKQSSRLKCWSAGCSYGAEAHSLAAILDAKHPGSHTILGSDIDQSALTQARDGVFSRDDMKGVPPEYRKYFAPDGERYRAVLPLKKYLNFKKHNLLADPFESGFDLIMCRNVVIYFTDEAKDALYERFFKALRPGGILFVGSTERIFNSGKVGYEQYHPFFYRKPLLNDNKLLSENKWRSAS